MARIDPVLSDWAVASDWLARSQHGLLPIFTTRSIHSLLAFYSLKRLATQCFHVRFSSFSCVALLLFHTDPLSPFFITLFGSERGFQCKHTACTMDDCIKYSATIPPLFGGSSAFVAGACCPVMFVLKSLVVLPEGVCSCSSDACGMYCRLYSVFHRFKGKTQSGRRRTLGFRGLWVSS